MRMPRDARILFCMSAKASYIRLDFRVSSSARISLGNQYPRVSPLPLTLLSLLPPSHTRPSPCLLPLASRIAPRDSRLRAPLLDNLSTRSPTAPPTPVPPPPLALSSIFSPFLPNRHPSPSPPPRSFVLALRLFVLLPSFQREEAIPLHLAGILFLFPFRPHLPLLRYHYCIALVVLAIRLW